MIATDEDLSVYAAIMLFTDEAIASKRAAISAFYDGLADAIAYLQETDPAEYIDLVMEKGDFAPEIAQVLYQTRFDDLQMPQKEQYDAIMEWLTVKNEIQPENVHDFAVLIDDSFLMVQ